MAKFQEQSCRLCLNFIKDTNFTVIEDYMRNMVDLVLPNHQLNDKSGNIMCGVCSAKLIAAFEFKSACLYADNIIKTYYIDCEIKLPLDIKDIYVKEVNDKQLIDALDDEKVCRLCMQLVTREVTSIEELDHDVIQCYFPEINFNITREPIVCNKCLNSFLIHGAFLKVSLKSLGVTKNDSRNEEKGHSFVSSSFHPPVKNEYIETKIVEDEENGFIKTEEIQIKSEGHRSESVENKEIVTTRREEDSSQFLKMYKCNSCSYKTKKKFNFQIHYLKHGEPSLLETYKCDNCSYLTNNKHYLKRHRLKHHDTSPLLEMYKCDRCDYETKQKSLLTSHFLYHKNEWLTKLYCLDAQMYKCDNCSYETKNKFNFKKHYLKHTDPSLLEMYKCDKCSYETAHKYDFKKHNYLKHTDPSLLKIFKCDSCSYESANKNDYKKHYMKHTDPSLLKMYKCDHCSYESKYKSSFKKHCLKHTHPSLLEMYKCDNCSYETKYKYCFKQHCLKHADPSELIMYKCDKCSFETKYKSNFKQHYLKHTDPSELIMYKCDKCSFETKYVSSFKQHCLKHSNH